MAGTISASVLQLFRNALNLKDDDEEPSIDLQVGKKVFHGVEKKMRTELWMSVLHRKGIGIAAAKKYKLYLQQEVEAQTADDISKDVHRTFPNVRRFSSEEGRRSLQNVLRAYAAYDPEVGYCQGMNFLGGVLLAWMPSEADAFGGLVVLMVDRGLRDLYKHDMSLLQARLWQVGRLLPARLASHLEMHGVLPVLYASSWLLTGFASDFPLFFSSRVMDVILTDRYVEAMMKLVVGIVMDCGGVLLALDDMEEIVEVLKVSVPRWPREKLQQLLTRSFAATWTPRQLRVLEQTEGAESVVDAVARVARSSQDEGDGLEPAPAASKAPGAADGLPSFRWADSMRATNRQLPSLPAVLLPPQASLGNAAGVRTPPSPASASGQGNETRPPQSPPQPARDLLDVRLSWPHEARPPEQAQQPRGWDPFAAGAMSDGPLDEDHRPSLPGGPEGDWTPFANLAVAPIDGNPLHLDARLADAGADVHPGGGHGCLVSGAGSLPWQSTGGTDFYAALSDVGLDGAECLRGDAPGQLRTLSPCGRDARGQGGPPPCAQGLPQLPSNAGTASSSDWHSTLATPRSPFAWEEDDGVQGEVGAGAVSPAPEGVSSSGALGSAGRRRSGAGLPPPHRSTSGKSFSGTRASGSGGISGAAGRSESWGSFTGTPFTSIDAAANVNGRLTRGPSQASADLESWGSFRQPSEDGRDVTSLDAQSRVQQHASSDVLLDSGSLMHGDAVKRRGDSLNGYQTEGSLDVACEQAMNDRENANTGAGQGQQHSMHEGFGGVLGEFCQMRVLPVLGRSDGQNTPVLKAPSLAIPGDRGKSVVLTSARLDGQNTHILKAPSLAIPGADRGKPVVPTSVSTPDVSAGTGGAAGGPVPHVPRQDSALELDLLSRFMREEAAAERPAIKDAAPPRSAARPK